MDIFLNICLASVSFIAGVWFIQSRARGPALARITLDQISYRMGESIAAEICIDSGAGVSFDEAVLTLYCEERVGVMRNGERREEWRRLFSKTRSLVKDIDVPAGRCVKFDCSLGLPDCAPEEVKGSFGLADMARIMRAQLSGEGLPSRRATDRPGERLLQLVERHRLEDVHWRLEILLLSEGRTLAARRVDVPVRGFAKRSQDAPELLDKAA